MSETLSWFFAGIGILGSLFFFTQKKRKMAILCLLFCNALIVASMDLAQLRFHLTNRNQSQDAKNEFRWGDQYRLAERLAELKPNTQIVVPLDTNLGIKRGLYPDVIEAWIFPRKFVRKDWESVSSPAVEICFRHREYATPPCEPWSNELQFSSDGQTAIAYGWRKR